MLSLFLFRCFFSDINHLPMPSSIFHDNQGKASATGFLTAGIFIYMVLISLKFKYLFFLNAITLSVALQGGSLLGGWISS